MQRNTKRPAVNMAMNAPEISASHRTRPRRALCGLVAAVALSASVVGLFAAPAHATCEFPRSISISDARAYEGTDAGTTTLLFNVSSAGCDNQSSVTYSTANGFWAAAAVAPGDYGAKSGTLSWAAGDASDRIISVNVVRDALDEPNEFFTVKLSNPTGFTVLDDPSADGVILDDDGPTTWNVDDAACTEGNPSGLAIYTVCSFNISVSKASAAATTVKVSTANGTAIAPDDYNSSSASSVTMPANAKTTTDTVWLRRDRLCEGDETFKVQLSSPSIGSVADGTGVITIIEDDFLC